MAKVEAAPLAAPEAGALAARTRSRRAVEAAIRGVPLAAFDALVRAFERDAGGAANQVLLWSRPGDWRNQAPGPDPETLALAAFLDTREAGPLVLEIPPADDGPMAGVIVDGRLRPLAALGRRGIDRGEGARLLVLPPGYVGDVPDDCIVLPSMSWRGGALLHSLPQGASEADRLRAASHLKRMRLYPLAAVGRPPATRFVEAADAVVDARLPFDARLFETLARVLRSDPGRSAEQAIEGLLASVGIVHGREFAPDAGTAALLAEAAAEARDWLRAVDESARPCCWPDRRWGAWDPSTTSPGDVALAATPADRDAAAALRAVAWQQDEDTPCLIATRDRRGEPLDGARTYRLHLPAQIPAAGGWAIAAYDAETHTLLRDVPHAARSSRTPGTAPGADSAVDLFFGPAPPAGRESAWIPTRAGIRWEAVLRLRGAAPGWRTGSWTPGDLEPR